MKRLVVQKRLPYNPCSLDRQAAAFLREVRRLVDEARRRYSHHGLELADMGFVPAAAYVEVRLYFQPPPGAEREEHPPPS